MGSALDSNREWSICRELIVIPNLHAEGGQERDLTSACASDAVWLRGF